MFDGREDCGPSCAQHRPASSAPGTAQAPGTEWLVLCACAQLQQAAELIPRATWAERSRRAGLSRSGASLGGQEGAQRMGFVLAPEPRAGAQQPRCPRAGELGVATCGDRGMHSRAPVSKGARREEGSTGTVGDKGQALGPRGKLFNPELLRIEAQEERYASVQPHRGGPSVEGHAPTGGAGARGGPPGCPRGQAQMLTGLPAAHKGTTWSPDFLSASHPTLPVNVAWGPTLFRQWPSRAPGPPREFFLGS